MKETVVIYDLFSFCLQSDIENYLKDHKENTETGFIEYFEMEIYLNFAILFHFYFWQTHQSQLRTGMSDFGLKWVRLTPKGKTLGLFQIRFQNINFGSASKNVLKSDLKIPRTYLL